MIFLAVTRIGEAANPGPPPHLHAQARVAATTSLDDPEAFGEIDEDTYEGGADANWEVGDLAAHEPDLAPDLAAGLAARSPEDRQTLMDFIISRRAEVAVEQATRRAEQQRCGRPPDFIACKKYTGTRAGMAFKLGEEGLGYHRDGGPTISVMDEVWPLHGTPPVTLVVDELVPPTSCPPPQTPRTAPNRSRRRKRKQGGSTRIGPEALQPTKLNGETQLCSGGEHLGLDSQCPTWPDDGSLAAGCEQHRQQGLWAVDSVNPDCWPSALEYLKMSAADLALIQECRDRQGPSH